MATRHATGRLRRPSAMQLNHIGIPEGANVRPVRYLPTDLCAIGSSGWTRSAGRSYRRMLLVPVIVVASGAGFGSTLRVELYQGVYQLYGRTIAAFADRR